MSCNRCVLSRMGEQLPDLPFHECCRHIRHHRSHFGFNIECAIRLRSLDMSPTDARAASDATAHGGVIPRNIEFARLSTSIDDRMDRRDVQKLVQGCKEFNLAKMVALAQACASDRPCVRMYSSDATPQFINQSWNKALGNRRINRRGKRAVEFLCERLFVRGWDMQGSRTQSVVISEQRPMTKGKAGWSVFAFAVEFAPSLRSCGYGGPAISADCFDRGAYSVLLKVLPMAHKRAAAESMRDMSGVEALLDFCLVIPDVPHDIHNSSLWSLRSCCDTTEANINDMWVAIASVRNAYDMIMIALPGWLQDNVQWIDTPAPPDFLEEL